MLYYSPLRYPGGKRKLARFIAAVCRVHGINGHYVEPYAGGAKIEKQEDQLADTGFDQSEYDHLKKQLKAKEKVYHGRREKLITLRGDLKQTSLHLRQAEESIREEKKKRKLVEKETAKIGSLSKLEKLMNDFKSDLISRIQPVLAAKTSELYRQMTSGRYPSVELDEDYNIRIEDEGNSFVADRFSGGEQDLASLCLRIAISQELSVRGGGTGSNFVALDEIFGSQDDERKSNILGVLSELSKQFRQVLLITHIEDVKESLPMAFHVKEKNNTVEIETEGILPSLR